MIIFFAYRTSVTVGLHTSRKKKKKKIPRLSATSRFKFIYVNVKCHLYILSIFHIFKIASLSGIERLAKLECLNLANTPIVTDSLLLLKRCPNLTALNVSDTPYVNGDLALEYITGKFSYSFVFKYILFIY